MTREELLRKTRLFVLDLDGTVYLGNDMLPGSTDFLRRVEETGREYLFLTNNSSLSYRDYIARLAGMDWPIQKKHIMTSGDVTIQYLKTRYPDASVYLVGTPSLEQGFLDEGIRLTREMPDIVVVSLDVTLTYEKLIKACTYIRNGALFLATHLDVGCPTPDGFIPDCGSLCACISTCTGVQPKYLGKPCKETMDMVLSATGYSRDEVAFVGDRLNTDVATGVLNGAAGILVLSGATSLEEVPGSDVQPTAIFESLAEMTPLL